MVKKFVWLLLAAFILNPLTGRAAPADAAGPLTLDGRIAVNAFEALVEEHLNGVLRGLEGLAATQDAQSGDWERIKVPLARLQGDRPTGAAIWFARPDGTYFTVAGDLTDQTLKDRPYFPRLMAGGTVEGDLVISKSSGHRTVIVAAPVRKDGRVVGALGVSISASRLAKIADDGLGLPKDMVFYALDAEGRTALHRDSTLIFQFPSDIGDETLKTAVQKMLSQPEGSDEYDFRGAHRIVMFKKSAVTGWVFAVGVSRER